LKQPFIAFLSLTTALGGVTFPAAAQTMDNSDPPTTAQPAESGVSDASATSGDIVVMARRRAESLQTVPVAVTAVSNKALQEQNITTMLDLPRVSPGLHTEPSGGASRNLPLYSIRGQQQGEFLASTDPSVGIYWGDVLIQRAYGADLNIFDLQQIEVLKGPQGTLFGRNTTGGNIVFRANTPTDKLEAGAYLLTGSYQQVQAQAYVNLPLDRKSTRLNSSHNPASRMPSSA
jgi:iron complex outermembrane receptor protein